MNRWSKGWIEHDLGMTFSFLGHKHFVHPSHLYAIGVAICMYPAHIADMSLDNVSLSSQCFLSDRLGYLALTFDAGENMLYYSGNFTNTISSVPLESGAKSKVVASGTGTVKGQCGGGERGERKGVLCEPLVRLFRLSPDVCVGGVFLLLLLFF